MSATKIDYAALLKEALRKLNTLHTEVESLRRVKTEAIAIVGMACRFPGADTPEAFWQLLQAGVDQTRPGPADRWDPAAYYAAEPGSPGKMYVRQAAFLDEVGLFDPAFFGISPREATSLDPQQRLLLEVSWEALERAGQAPQQLANSQTGIFVGIGQTDYAQRTLLGGNAEQLDVYTGTGNQISFAAGRLSYALGLQGPSIALDTACSASLVAVHLACQSLRLGECDLALAGGVQLMLSPLTPVMLSQMEALSPDGRCKTFDAAADGYGRGEGCGVVVLKRLAAAQQAGDPILAVIRGSAVNHDGPSSGLTVPSRAAQEALLRRALANAQVEPNAVGYLETHGTGTPLGDPIELRALGAVFGQARPTGLWVGSVKTNIGHLEAAAGIAGLIKVALALQHGEIPPHLHVHTPTPHVDWQKLQLQIPLARTPWPAAGGNGPRVAGVSSFGMSGTNAHVILAEAPPPIPSSGNQAGAELPERSWQLLTLSAKSAAALADLAARYQSYLAGETTAALADLCYTANSGRNHFAYRAALVAQTRDDLRAQLAALAQGKAASGVQQGYFADHQSPPQVAFLFTGQGAQYVNMGRELYQMQPVFRQTLDHCAELLRPYLETPLLAVLYPDPEASEPENSPLDQTAYTQPALFAFEYALAQMWLAWGIEPALVMGHSVGELVAACVAGVFSLADGLKLVARRGQLMQALPPDGAMVAVLADETTVAQALAGQQGEVAIAAFNGPQNVVISGRRVAVERIAGDLAGQGIKTQPLTVSHAFHSPLMEPMVAAFAEVAQSITYHPPRLPLIANVTGALATETLLDWRYWVRHVQEPVRFAQGLTTLLTRPLAGLVEIGPKPTLLGMAAPLVGDKSQLAMLPSLRTKQSDWRQLLESLAALYVLGGGVNWTALDTGRQRHKVILPTYPFQRQRYWVEWQPAGQPTRQQPQGNQPTSNQFMGRQPGVASHMQPMDVQEIEIEQTKPEPIKVENMTSFDRPFANPERNVAIPIQNEPAWSGPNQRPSTILSGAPEKRQAELEHYLSQLLGKALGIAAATLPLDQPLTNLGLDSLMIMALKREMQRELGVNLPVETLLQGHSIKQVAAQVAAQLGQPQPEPGQAARAAPLVALQPDGKQPPFFLIHPIAGTVFPYYQLAGLLGPDQPVYGLQAVEINGLPALSMEQMALTYIGAIRTVQPQGPYFLGGWSFGAFVAFEMARQLDLVGARVGLVASIDQAALAADKLTRAWKGLEFLATTAIPNLWPYARHYLQWPNPQNGAYAARKQYHAQAAGDLVRFTGANTQALMVYHPAPYRQRLTLFQTTEQRQNLSGDPTWGWDKLAQGGVECIEISGHHMNLLQEPHVYVLAERLRTVLQQAQTAAGVVS